MAKDFDVQYFLFFFNQKGISKFSRFKLLPSLGPAVCKLSYFDKNVKIIIYKMLKFTNQIPLKDYN